MSKLSVSDMESAHRQDALGVKPSNSNRSTFPTLLAQSVRRRKSIPFVSIKGVPADAVRVCSFAGSWETRMSVNANDVLISNQSGRLLLGEEICLRTDRGREAGV